LAQERTGGEEQLTSREVKERPGCRKAILELGLQPLTINGQWDGHMVVTESRERTAVAAGMKTEMHHMLAAGFWTGVRLKGVRGRPELSLWR
jgi:hypothetical protein